MKTKQKHRGLTSMKMRRRRKGGHRHGKAHGRKFRKGKFFGVSWKEIKEIYHKMLLKMINSSEKSGLVKFEKLKALHRNKKELGRFLDIMEQNGDIEILNKGVKLTTEGLQKARNIRKKYEAIKNSFDLSNSSKNLTKFEIEKIMEKFLDERDLQNLQNFHKHSLNPQNIYNLSEFKFPAAIVHKIIVPSDKIVYKLLSLGVYPGQRIFIEKRTKINQIIQVKGSRFVIDHNISKNILVTTP